jgi:uncharacterized phage-associated protein
MRYPAVSIANYFIDKANVEDNPLDHLRLQKLVYNAHGWHLAEKGTPLIEEPVEAWKYGPVIRSLFKEFKKYGNGFITENAGTVSRAGVSVPNVQYGDEETRELLDRVWKLYEPFSGVELSRLTHAPGTPWLKTWNLSGGKGNAKISDRDIEAHFRKLHSRIAS